MTTSFKEIFPNPKPIIGMIHLAGDTHTDKVKRALEELAIYDEEGVDGAIIEDYHGSMRDVVKVLAESKRQTYNLQRGVNLLRESWRMALVQAQNHRAKFVQFDSVQTPDIDIVRYDFARKAHPDIAVLGGVRFKYKRETGNSLEQDVREAMPRCEAIVTTGAGTGMETPIAKLQEFRNHLPTFPLLVGAGVKAENVCDQLLVTDGAIVGSYFKPGGNTQLPIDRSRVREFMDVVQYVRKAYSQVH